jgi:hypothetical protein
VWRALLTTKASTAFIPTIPATRRGLPRAKKGSVVDRGRRAEQGARQYAHHLQGDPRGKGQPPEGGKDQARGCQRGEAHNLREQDGKLQQRSQVLQLSSHEGDAEGQGRPKAAQTTAQPRTKRSERGTAGV